MILIFFTFTIDNRLNKGSLFKADFIETLYSEDKRYIFKGKIWIWSDGFRIEVNDPFIQVIIGKEDLKVYTRGIDFPSVYENKFPLNKILFNTHEFMSSYKEGDKFIRIIPKDTMYVKDVYVWKKETIERIQLNLPSQKMVFVIKNVKITNRFSKTFLTFPPLWE